MASQILNAIRNDSLTGRGRRFPGLNAPHPALGWVVPPRDAVAIDIVAGDVLSLHPQEPFSSPTLVAFNDRGECALTQLGLSSNCQLKNDEFASEALKAWITAQGGQLKSDIASFRIPSLEDTFVIKAKGDCTLWVVNPVEFAKLLDEGSVGRIRVELKQSGRNEPLLPLPLGHVHDEFTVSKATATSYQLRKGQVVQVIDVEGQQCSDFMALRADDLDLGKEKIIDSTVTRTVAGGAYPAPGLYDKFFDSDIRPMLKLVQDTVGRHDTFALACTARGYEERGFPGHVNCSDNISDSFAAYGVNRRVAWPAINFFFNSWIDSSDNRLRSEEAWSRPGDYVAMEALTDLVCVSTACPDDIDPINGWNPTDIHVRIYDPEPKIQRAVAYREKESNILSISEESPFHPRTSALTQQFQAVRDLWLPVTFPGTGTLGEYWACRNSVVVQDMSSIRKFDIVGPDAEKLLQLAMTRDIAKLPVWRGIYTLMCDDQGTIIDDGTLFRIGQNLFRWCCGTEESGRVLTTLAEQESLQVRIMALGNSMPNLAIQGPRSRELLNDLMFTQPHVPSITDMKWFGATIARFHDRDGPPLMLTRSGYTGELGYELFCDKSDALQVWDAISEAGKPLGLEPMGSAALDTVRIEAGLMAAGAEFGDGISVFESGLEFAVDFAKADFVGKAALERTKGANRFALRGLIFDSDEFPLSGQQVYVGERPVGVVTSATHSPSLECGIAMARISVEKSETGMELEVGQMDGHMKRLAAKVVDIPFVDPKRAKART